MNTPPLEARNLGKIFGKHIALDDLSLTIDHGEVFCLLGANGAGKTTTLSLFLNLLNPTSGQALVNGYDVVRHPTESKAKLAYLPENVSLYGNLSGLENLRYFASFTAQGDPGASEASRLLDSAGVPRTAFERPLHTYSKGMRQKVGIAIAMAKNANILLLDEPTSGLDPKASNDFTDLILQRCADGTACLMATHDIYRSWECGHRFGIMRAGRLRRIYLRGDTTLQELEAAYLEEMAESHG